MGECSWKYGNTTRSGVWRCGGIKIEHVEVVAVSGSRDAGGTCQYAAGSDTVQTYVHMGGHTTRIVRCCDEVAGNSEGVSCAPKEVCCELEDNGEL